MTQIVADAARWIVAVEMLTLIGSLTAIVGLHEPYVRAVPRTWHVCSAAVVMVLGVCTMAVVVNALVAGPQTPGVKILAVAAAPAALLAVTAVVQSMSHPVDPRTAAVIGNARPLGEAIEHLAHAAPCHDPACQTYRRAFRVLAGIDDPEETR